MLRLAVLALALVALAASGCRDDLCIITFKATCQCDDPQLPDVSSCVASLDVVTCSLDAGVDPCAQAPCCRLAHPDGGHADLARASDGGASDPADASASLDGGGDDGAVRADGGHGD